MSQPPQQPQHQKHPGWTAVVVVGAVILLGGGWWVWSSMGDGYAVGEKIDLAPERRGGRTLRQMGDVLRSLGSTTRPARRTAQTTRPASRPGR